MESCLRENVISFPGNTSNKLFKLSKYTFLITFLSIPELWVTVKIHLTVPCKYLWWQYYQKSLTSKKGPAKVFIKWWFSFAKISFILTDSVSLDQHTHGWYVRINWHKAGFRILRFNQRAINKVANQPALAQSGWHICSSLSRKFVLACYTNIFNTRVSLYMSIAQQPCRTCTCLDWLQSLNNFSSTLVASLTLMALRAIRVRLATSVWYNTFITIVLRTCASLVLARNPRLGSFFSRHGVIIIVLFLSLSEGCRIYIQEVKNQDKHEERKHKRLTIELLLRDLEFRLQNRSSAHHNRVHQKSEKSRKYTRWNRRL